MNDILSRNNVKVSGSGNQTLLFAHGFGCDQNVWRHITPAFSRDFKIVTFDYVGAGGSDLSAYSSERYGTLHGYATDILEICEELQLSDVIFVGHSVSSMIGLKAAIRQPDLFKQLIFVAPSASYINDGNYIGGFEKDDLLALFDVMDNNYLGWSSNMGPLVMGNADRPELAEELTKSFCTTNPKIAKEFARVTFFSDSRAELKALTIPSLTIQCSNDLLAPLEVGRYINNNTPLNAMTVLNATGHCPHLSAPVETTRAIAQFIEVHNYQLAS